MPQMTPMVRAAIGLLARSNLEIEALVRDRLSGNPWLVEYPRLPFPSDAPIESGHDAGQILEVRALCATRPQTDALEHEVAALIQEETAAETEPLSDERIALLLRNRGYRIARRTVAKHRVTLGIGHAYQRRRANVSASTNTPGAGLAG